jgi:hypothetical protein
MGFGCLTECSSCKRHVRCGERACPFCGAPVTSFMRVLEYRLLNRLDRARALSLGAAMTAAGFVTSCGTSVPIYGAPCNPPDCASPEAGSTGSPEGGARSDGSAPDDGGTSSDGGEGGAPPGGSGGESD